MKDKSIQSNHLSDSSQLLEEALLKVGYRIDPSIALIVWLALKMDKPILVEGPAGVGKTDLARAMSTVLNRKWIRLQCYEGLDESKSLYEWNYTKQMLYTQLMKDVISENLKQVSTLKEGIEIIGRQVTSFYQNEFLLARPLLFTLLSDEPCVLLIDEVDRSDSEFEAFLLEFLSEFQVTIPELGTIRAKHKPLVILTSNATRDMTEALRRRCLHAFLEYPTPSREKEIIRLHLPTIEEDLLDQVVRWVKQLREMDLQKVPSISETIDWTRVLILLNKQILDPELVQETLGILVKHEQDVEIIKHKWQSLWKQYEKDKI